METKLWQIGEEGLKEGRGSGEKMNQIILWTRTNSLWWMGSLCILKMYQQKIIKANEIQERQRGWISCRWEADHRTKDKEVQVKGLGNRQSEDMHVQGSNSFMSEDIKGHKHELRLTSTRKKKENRKRVGDLKKLYYVHLSTPPDEYKMHSLHICTNDTCPLTILYLAKLCLKVKRKLRETKLEEVHYYRFAL